MPPARSIVSDQLDRIETAIIGNGQEGLLGRTARIEENVKNISELADEAKLAAINASAKAEEEVAKTAVAVNNLAMSVIKMEMTVANHIGTDHLSVLMKKRGFWALIVVGFITLHLVATYLPNVWDGLVTFLGVPKLSLPIP